MESWIGKRVAEEQTRAEIKIQGDIFEENSLSSQLFVIAMIPLNCIQRKYKASDKVARKR